MWFVCSDLKGSGCGIEEQGLTDGYLNTELRPGAKTSAGSSDQVKTCLTGAWRSNTEREGENTR